MERTSGSKTVLQSIQALRAIAASLVVLYHTRVIIDQYGSATPILWMFDHGEIGVDLFFVLSGFIMAHISMGKEASGFSAVRDFLANRLIRIIPPYWLYTTLCLVIILVAPQLTKGDTPSIWRSYLLIPDENNFLLMVGWTLSYEVFFYIIFAFGLFSQNRRIQWGAVGSILVGLVLLGAWLDDAGPVLKVLTSPLLLEFLSGVALAIVYHRHSFLLAPGVGIFCGLASCLSYWALFYGPLEELGLSRFLQFGIPAFLLVTAALSFEVHRRAEVPRYLVKIGDASYSLYLTHWLGMHAIGIVWRKLGLSSDWLLALIVFVSCIIFALVSYKTVERRLPDFVRAMLAKVLVPSAQEQRR